MTIGASGALINEMVQEKLGEVFEDDPAMHQWASALIGGVVSEIVSGNTQAGASTSVTATKYNFYQHLEPIKQTLFKIRDEGYLDKLEEGKYYTIILSLTPELKNYFSKEEISKVWGNSLDGTIGVTIDKFGKIYDVAGISVNYGAGISLPGNVTVVEGKIPNYKNKQDYENNLTGFSWAIDTNFTGVVFTGSIGVENGAGSDIGGLGISFSVNYTSPVGSIYDKHTFELDYEHNLGMYNVLRSDSEGVQAYISENGTVNLIKNGYIYSDQTFKWVPIANRGNLKDGWRLISNDYALKLLTEKLK